MSAMRFLGVVPLLVFGICIPMAAAQQPPCAKSDLEDDMDSRFAALQCDGYSAGAIPDQIPVGVECQFTCTGDYELVGDTETTCFVGNWYFVGSMPTCEDPPEPTCDPACGHGGVCTATDTCDCTGVVGFTGPTCSDVIDGEVYIIRNKQYSANNPTELWRLGVSGTTLVMDGGASDSSAIWGLTEWMPNTYLIEPYGQTRYIEYLGGESVEIPEDDGTGNSKWWNFELVEGGDGNEYYIVSFNDDRAIFWDESSGEIKTCGTSLATVLPADDAHKWTLEHVSDPTTASSGGGASTGGGIICGDTVEFFIESSDPEWTEFKFPNGDPSSSQVYISDELSVKSNTGWFDGSNGDDSWSTVEASECFLTTTSTSMTSASLDLDQCKPDLDMNATHIIYTYTVWHDPRDLTKQINREEPASVCYHCVMVRDQEINSLVIKPQMTIDHYDTLGVEGTFTINLVLQQPKGYDLSDSASVDVNTRVWIKASLTGVDSTDDTLAIGLTDCWASPNINYYRQYQFIRNDCPVDDGVGYVADDDEGFTKIVTQGTETYAEARFQAFVWNRVKGEVVSPTDAAVQKIYITCVVQVCSETYQTSQTETCADEFTCSNGDENENPGHPRRKRSVGKFRRDATEKTQFPSVTLTAHPVSINADY